MTMKKLAVLLATILLFVAINAALYRTLTCRLANNFSGTNQLKMIDVGRYLPFEERSELARTGSSLKFQPGDKLPVLDGAAALVPVYASVIENCYPKGSVTYEGGAFSDDNYYGENFASDSVMQYQNTVRGFDAVVDGSVDLFFGARPSPEQARAAEEKGVELELVPIGLEAFVFFVNKENPVNGLTTEQLRAIYRGEITDWKEVGGAPGPIHPITRIPGSGSQTMMDIFMEGDIRPPRGPKALFSVFGRSIGYSFRYYVTGIVADDRVKLLAVDGVYPDSANIGAGLYPISGSFYAIYRKDNANPNVARLVEWLLSEEGQRMIEATGYVRPADRVGSRYAPEPAYKLNDYSARNSRPPLVGGGA